MAVTAKIWASALFFMLSFFQNECHVTRFGKSAESLFFPPLSASEKLGHKVKIIEAKVGDDVDEFLRRFPRSATTPSPASDFPPPADLRDNHTTLIVHWAGINSDVIIALGRNSLRSSSPTKVHVSFDYGKTFRDISDKMKINTTTRARIARYYNTPAHNSHYIFTDIEHNCTFTTVDFTTTFQTYCGMPFRPRTIAINAKNPNLVLGMDEESEEKELFISEDFCFTWRKIQGNVKSFFWGVAPYDNVSKIYVEEERSERAGNIVYSSDSLFRGWGKDVVINGVKDFEVRGRYLFATKKDGLTTSHTDIKLFVSSDRKPFKKAEFPTPENQEYYIADASEDQVMVCVNHNKTTTNLYISEVKGLRFSLSLPNVVYFNPKGANKDTWLRYYTNDTFADIHRVDGMRGIFIASQLTGNTFDIDKQRSLITFDKGGEWQLITAPPEGDRETNCMMTNCSLHLTQQLHRLYPGSRASPILSRTSAPGLIIASGVIGTNIKMNPNVFVSSDAGVSWNQILHGEYMYTFADHGGIIVASKQFEETDSIFFSMDYGLTWHEKKISAENIRIYGILTEPGEATTIFSIFGSRLSHHSWMIAQLDMVKELKKKCTADDYKLWSFSMKNSTKSCLLGRHTVYERRIRDAVCYNGNGYDRPIRSVKCPCTRLDYECDFGFVQRDSYDCVQDMNMSAAVIHKAPTPCPQNTYYPYSRGYRKVAGDTCSGGDEHRYAPLMYSCPIQERQEFVVYSTRTKITRINLDTKRQQDLVTRGLDEVTALDFDYRNNCLYWADITQDRISRLCLEGNRTDVEPVIVENLHTVEALALDWTSNNLYWIDSETKGIYVSLTTGQYRRTLFQGDAYLDRPRGLALDPHHGYMYWSDWSISNPRINRAWMDGTNTSIETIVNKTYVRWPNGLAVDLPSEKIYWTDAGLHKIMTADLDGRNIQTLVFGISAVPHPYSIGVFKNNIYWTDWKKGAVMTASKSGLGLMTFINLTDIVDMKVVSHTSQQAKSACTPASCSQLCLPRPPPSDHKRSHNRTCKCGDKVSHSILPSGDEQCMCGPGQRAVNKTCVNVPMNSTSCEAHKFQCGNSRCVPLTWKCDNENDCGDRSDEIDCPLTTCPDTSFTCENSKCIPLRWKCDYDNDCGDSSDEHNCQYPTCNSQQFPCANGRCINANWRCDNDNDCHDGSDELNCTDTTSSPAQRCQPWEHRCLQGGCISQQAVCNGFNDCPNGSDEAHCQLTTCSSWRHMCAAGNQCIFATWVCDGEPDCSDSSDEENCTTTTAAPSTTLRPSACHLWQFTCGNQMCVFHASRCDGYNDCGDNSDEENCGEGPLRSTTPPPQCGSGRWQCTYDKTCVRLFDRCNGIVDCSDGTDEDNCDVTCDEDHFECYNTDGNHQRRCIWGSWVCDGEADCSSGEDELNCNRTCGPTEFSCEYTQGCVPFSQRCNGVNDCVDSSDERGCGTQPSFPISTTTAPRKQCLKHQFLCPMENRCILWFKVCDRNIDCRDDHADELVLNCRTDHGHFVDTSAQVNSKNITVMWDEPYPHVGDKHCLYIVSKLLDEDNSSWMNYSVDAMSFTLLKLSPLTKYQVAVYVNCSGQVSPHSRALKLITSAPVPGAPRNLNVHKTESQTVTVEWDAPTTHKDIIDHYTIYYQDMNNTFYPLSSQQVKQKAKTITYSFTESQLTVNHIYKFWVTASNSQGEGQKSKTITHKFTMQRVEQIGKVTIESKTKPNRFVLSWDAVKGAKRYVSKMTMRLTTEQDELTTVISSTNPNVTFDKICPGYSYAFEITPVFSFGHGRHSQVLHKMFTNGPTVYEPKGVTVNKTGSREATISVVQKEANLRHIIYYYERELDLQDFLKKAKRVNMTGSSKVIHGLKSCEVYYFRVAAVQDGCPVTYPQSIETDPDSTAPPKLDNIQVESLKDNIWANVTWRAPCDYEVTPLDYSIEKTEINSSGSKILVEHISLGKATKNIFLWHKLPNLNRGATYQIRVRTNLKGSEFSEPKNITIAPYGAPADFLSQDVGNGFVYLSWAQAPKYRPTIKGNNIMLYRLDITPPDKPDLIITKLTNKTSMYIKLETERLFQAKIRYNKIDGFYGEAATVEFILNNGTSIAAPTTGVISTTNLVTILVPIGVIVLILAVVLSIYVIRHRRLQRSFMAFANSHYDPRSGTTRFTAADDLGDDDDAPLIQGFSDDVPLVIA